MHFTGETCVYFLFLFCLLPCTYTSTFLQTKIWILVSVKRIVDFCCLLAIINKVKDPTQCSLARLKNASPLLYHNRTFCFVTFKFDQLVKYKVNLKTTYSSLVAKEKYQYVAKIDSFQTINWLSKRQTLKNSYESYFKCYGWQLNCLSFPFVYEVWSGLICILTVFNQLVSNRSWSLANLTGFVI